MKSQRGSVSSANDESVEETTSGQRRAASDDHDARAALIDATVRIIAGQGLGAATSRRITEAAELNLAAITYHFGSKGALVQEALSAELERLVDPALALLETDGDPGANLLAAVQQLLGSFAAERDRAPAYLTALVESARSDDGGMARSVMRRLRERLAIVVRGQVDAQVVPAWVDPDAMAALIVAAANGIVLQSAVDPDGPTVEQTAAQLALLFLTARSEP